MRAGELRAALRGGRFLLPEVTIAAGLVVCSWLGLFPFGGTPVLVAFGALSLWLRGEGPRGVGLRRDPGWWRIVLIGVTAGLGYQFLSLYLVEPLTARVVGRLPDVSMFAPLKSNVRLVVLYVAISWTLAGFGEEFVYRGYLLNRIAQLLGGRPRAWLVSLGATTVVFGLGHVYQGASGVIDTALFGFLFGVLYLLAGRNLWVAVIAHGVADTTAFVLLFFGRYPGV
ncbi:MAG TPA: CPBP family intramembrane glutamic endopeptidase [Gemmatimonadales bacterium]|nr:CPBP family intramembrane glutamic endopeptidase [Gemmatimonadales bacterium]